MIFIFSFFILTFVMVYNSTECKPLKYSILTLGYLLTIVQLSAYYTMGEPVNHQYYAHIDVDTILLSLQVAGWIILCSFVVVLIIFFLLNKLVVKVKKRLSFRGYCATLVLFLLFFLQFDSYRQLFVSPLFLFSDILHRQFSAKYTTEEILSNFQGGISLTTTDKLSHDYTTNNKNIIVIYLESLENTYLNLPLYREKAITKDLLNIGSGEDFVIYDNFPDTAGYTIGSIFATQCGLPALFNLPGNNMLKSLTSSKMVCFNKILKKAGYNSVFISGDSDEFGGRGHFLRLLEYKTISKDDFDDVSRQGAWGVYDTDVFEEAKKQLKILVEERKPFNLNILTLGPHHPNGFYDKECEKYVDKQILDIETMVSCNSYLTADFINYIKSIGILDNTVIYIMNDHIGMGGAINVDILNENKNRANFLLTNDIDINLSVITQAHFPEIVSRELEVNPHVTYLSQNFLPEDFVKSITNDREFYFSLNQSLNSRFSLVNGFEVIKENDSFILENSEHRIHFDSKYAYFSLSEDGFIESNFLSYEWNDAILKSKDDLFIFVGIENDVLKLKFSTYNDFYGIGFIGEGVLSSNERIVIGSDDLSL